MLYLNLPDIFECFFVNTFNFTDFPEIPQIQWAVRAKRLYFSEIHNVLEVASEGFLFFFTNVKVA